MQNKLNMTKTTILLILAVVLALSVCFSSVYGWFIAKSTASATVSAEVLSFYFTANDVFNGDFTINNISYDIDPDEDASTTNGMFPGQTMRAILTLSNKESNVNSSYAISLKGIESNNFPNDCLISLSAKDPDVTPAEDFTEIYAPQLIKTAIATNEGTIYSGTMSAGKAKVFEITIVWPAEYSADIHGEGKVAADAGYTDDATKNAGDNAFLSASKAGEGKDFSLAIEVIAEQVN